MTLSQDTIQRSAPYLGNSIVTFGNSILFLFFITTVSNHIKLKDVLVVLHLNKNLLSISKLTNDNPVDILFSQPFVQIQDRHTRQVLAQGKCENDLYILEEDIKLWLQFQVHVLEPLLSYGIKD